MNKASKIIKLVEELSDELTEGKLKISQKDRNNNVYHLTADDKKIVFFDDVSRQSPANYSYALPSSKTGKGDAAETKYVLGVVRDAFTNAKGDKKKFAEFVNKGLGFDKYPNLM